MIKLEGKHCSIVIGDFDSSGTGGMGAWNNVPRSLSFPHLLGGLLEEHPDKRTAQCLRVHLHPRTTHVVISPYSHLLGLWKFRIEHVKFHTFEGSNDSFGAADDPCCNLLRGLSFESKSG